ncbi:MAG: hypothetical protein FJ319_11830 [SAR202 cluster bacterium]|nr:hypothetical protein [SAR202 cluster bacterium]
MDRFRAARDKGAAYLLRNVHPDGSFGSPAKGVTDYYKVIWALQVAGETHAANSICNWVRRNGMTAEGDLGPRPPEANGYYYNYYNAWVVIGAHKLQQYDLSMRGMDFMLRTWDEESGGFFSSVTERKSTTEMDLWVVSGCGQAALITGHIDVARGVGRWMRTLMEQQPNFPKQLYSVYTKAQGLITKLDPATETRYVMSQDAQRDQYFFHPGIAGGFLSKLFMATGEREWLEMAKKYMVVAEGASDYLMKLGRAGKVAWAASVLWTLTGESKYRDMAIRIGDNIIAMQQPDGSWHQSNDGTAEMTAWLDEVYQAVGAG